MQKMKKDKNARKETKAAKVATAGQRKQAKDSTAKQLWVVNCA